MIRKRGAIMSQVDKEESGFGTALLTVIVVALWHLGTLLLWFNLHYLNVFIRDRGFEYDVVLVTWSKNARWIYVIGDGLLCAAIFFVGAAIQVSFFWIFALMLLVHILFGFLLRSDFSKDYWKRSSEKVKI